MKDTIDTLATCRTLTWTEEQGDCNVANQMEISMLIQPRFVLYRCEFVQCCSGRHLVQHIASMKHTLDYLLCRVQRLGAILALHTSETLQHVVVSLPPPYDKINTFRSICFDQIF